METQIQLSIVVPSINPDRWSNLLQSLKLALEDITYEVIFVGPKSFPEVMELNCLFVPSYGTPTIAMQVAAKHAKGKFLTWTSDDCTAYPGVFKKQFQAFLEWNKDNAGFTICPYIEGTNLGPNREQFFGPFYWTTWYHDGLRKVAGLEKDWIWGLFLVARELFYHVGGLDCGYEHVNYSIHDFCYRLQRMGYKAFIPEGWTYGATFEHRDESNPVMQAFKVDAPRFEEQYKSKADVAKLPQVIDYENYKLYPDNMIWKRRHKP